MVSRAIRRLSYSLSHSVRDYLLRNQKSLRGNEMARLVAIGDSLSQGFQSGAILKTEWSFPALIARALGLSLPSGFRIPSFPGNGLPLNMESLLHEIEPHLGNDISTGEWFFRFPTLLNQFIDDIEELYERGRGSRKSNFSGQYHNLSVWGFRVADSYTIDSEYSKRLIEQDEGRIEDDFLGLPSGPMYRTAMKVLNPGQLTRKNKWTQIDNLSAINQEEGVENLILWLGANDCLGTVFSLKIEQMPSDFSSNDPEERRQYNLTHPDIFKRDFQTLVERIEASISRETRVFVATVPHVTIPPITSGIGQLPVGSKYFSFYGRFFANSENFNSLFNAHLTGKEAELIDGIIDKFNEIIRQQVENKANWHIVDIGAMLDSLAVRRSGLTTSPDEPLKAYFRSLGIIEHPLLRLEPIPNILRLDTRDRTRLSGGLFSLDCVHPTTIGYGLVADFVLRKMQEVGVPGANPNHLNWLEIIANDSLLQAPPVLWDDIIAAAERNSTLWDIIFRVLN